MTKDEKLMQHANRLAERAQRNFYNSQVNQAMEEKGELFGIWKALFVLEHPLAGEIEKLHSSIKRPEEERAEEC